MLKNSKGFTLVELLVVMAVIAILAGFLELPLLTRHLFAMNWLCATSSWYSILP